MKGAIRSTRNLIVVVMTSTACVFDIVGAHAANAGSDASSGACALLTKQDAATALGEAVTGPESKSGLPMGPGVTVSFCEYQGSGLNKVHLNVWRASPEAATQFHQTYAAACAGKGTEGLAGLGDVACWYNDKHEELQVIQGPTFFSIEMRRNGNPTEAIKGVAKKVSDQLR